MHDSKNWFEKLKNGQYRVHSEQNEPKQIADLKRLGFSATSDKPNEFVRDYGIDDPILNFGVTMADCYNQIQDNQGFITAIMHLMCSRYYSANTRKEMLDSFTETEFISLMLNIQDLDEFLFTVAENYSESLVEEAKGYLDKGIEELAKWLRSGSVIFRNNSNNDIEENYVIDRKKIRADNCIMVFLGYGYAHFNPEAYEEWKERFDNDEHWIKFFKSYLDHNDEPDFNEKYFDSYYYFSSNNAADDLFEILSEKDPHYSIRTKRLIKKVLNDHSREDVEFAKELQRRYNEYKTLNDGEDIVFEVALSEESDKSESGMESLYKAAQTESSISQTQIEQSFSSDNERGFPVQLSKEQKTAINLFRIGKCYFTDKNKNKYDKEHCEITNVRFNELPAEDRAKKFQELIRMLARYFCIKPDLAVMRSCACALTGRGFDNPFEPVSVQWNPQKVGILFFICQKLYNKRDNISNMSKFKEPAELFNVIKEYKSFSNRSQSASKVNASFIADFNRIFPDL